jgi:hypothetical protein
MHHGVVNQVANSPPSVLAGTDCCAELAGRQAAKRHDMAGNWLGGEK